MDNTAKFAWFVAGAAVGAGIVFLYAPKSGRDTRRYLGKKARQSAEAVSDMSRDIAEKGRDLYEMGRKVADEAADLLERGRKLVEG
ncbi:MAG: YtxH domain-containing protein [Bryobacterales bacterium]|nr:YtxH domain-containing protein [Bryobacterales bacterium]MBV9397125.1 YtxH domain-containing protein [Bryobacterales bacterium]